ncbi:MAG TPA: class I SAM-dependent methyltransferase [Candidatus Acidoferrum sp.]|nr:class I SAM-dependent methyltransferase [Candidatus Acidoferrum sp.]
MTENEKNEARGSVGFSALQAAHARMVFGRRVRVLAECLSARIPPRCAVLDIGCGDGTIGSLLAKPGSEISLEGVEFAPRPQCAIRCRAFDGAELPFADGSFDVCLFVDVLHHTDDPSILLREARRVTRRFVLIKDHLSENRFDFKTLQFMDWVGNRPHGVRLPYNYQSRKEWEASFAKCGLSIAQWTSEVPLYPFPFSLLVGRGLHFVTLLEKV